MNPNLHVLILAGGSGTRLWPCSREELPKQFLSLEGDYTLLQETLLRMGRVVPAENLSVIVGSRWSALVRHQAKQVLGGLEPQLVEEPCARNTAPAITLGLAALRDSGVGDDDLVLVCPSDHVVRDEVAFGWAVEQASVAAVEGYLTVFGIVPDHPDTGFGYVKVEREFGGDEGSWAPVERFVEKPDLETAKSYLAEGSYLWNGGMFLFRVGDMLDELKRQVPLIFSSIEKGYEGMKEEFVDLRSVSIDYAVMEGAEKVAAVPLDAGWSDLGSWDAVYDSSPKDEGGNVSRGDVLLKDAKNNLIMADGRLVVGIGVEDLLVVDTPDALFVAPRGSSQRVREAVAALRESDRKEAVEPTSSVRPWGTYRVLFEGPRFKIKHITVEPGKRLSLQYHYHRTEHWVVVKGTALVTVGDEQKFVHEGESIFVAKNDRHRLENRGKIPLEIVEIQNGEYLGEDDIVRLQDDYRRCLGKNEAK